jgi:hypothetical protein
MYNKLFELTNSSFHQYRLEKQSSLIENCIQILWFGDLNKYSTSANKIITVSLNPSNNEFGFNF